MKLTTDFSDMCAECTGSGRNSSGGPCKPCKGTGHVPLTAEEKRRHFIAMYPELEARVKRATDRRFLNTYETAKSMGFPHAKKV